MTVHEAACPELTSADRAILVGFDAGETLRNGGLRMPELAIKIEAAMAPYLSRTAHNNYWRAGFTAGFLGILQPTPSEIDRVTLQNVWNLLSPAATSGVFRRM